MNDVQKKAVFFDRDGVIIRAVVRDGVPTPPYSIGEFKKKSGFIPGIEGVIKKVKSSGFLAILVTNQPDIVYGKISQEDFDYIQSEVAKLPFDDIFICFHGRDDNCECKKPKPGMVLEAAKKWNIDIAKSFFVGDTESDLEAARRSGCRSILLQAAYNKECIANHYLEDFLDEANFSNILFADLS